MNFEMKKLFSKFLLSTVIISCITALFAFSVVTAEEGEYIMHFKKYALMTISTSTEKIEAKKENEKIKIGIPLKKYYEAFETYAALTPASLPYYAVKSFENIIKNSG